MKQYMTFLCILSKNKQLVLKNWEQILILFSKHKFVIYRCPFVIGHIFFGLKVTHFHDSFVFRSKISHFPLHHSPPHILLLCQLIFPSHPMSSPIFSSPVHSICTTKNTCNPISFVLHIHKSSSYFHSFRTSYRQATSSDH